MGARKEVLKLDKITYEVIEAFGSVKEAAENAGKGYFDMWESITEKRVQKGKYVFRFKEDYDRYEVFDGKKNRPVVISDDDFSSWIEFYSLGDAAEFIGCTRDKLKTAIRRSHRVFNRWRAEFLR